MTHSSLKSIGVTTSFHEVVGNKSFRFPPSTRLNSIQWKSFPTPFWKQAAWINKACSVVTRWIIPISKKHINCGLILSALNHINGSSKKDGNSFSKFLEVHSGSETKYFWRTIYLKSTINIPVNRGLNDLLFSDQTFRLTKCGKYTYPNLFSGAIFAGNSNLQNENIDIEMLLLGVLHLTGLLNNHIEITTLPPILHNLSFGSIQEFLMHPFETIFIK